MNDVNVTNAALARDQVRREETANSVSHAIGLLAAIAGTPLLIVHAVQHGDTGYIVGCSIFAATMILLYLASTLYHALYHSPLKRIFQLIDHAVIYLLIAGTYTPFTLGVIHGAWGWSMFGVIWGMAAVGIILKLIYRMEHPYISTALYLAMGWISLVAAKPFYTSVPAAGLIWLLAGGVSYSAGVIFYVKDGRMRYSHFIWHWFVLGGTVSHYFAVWYAV